MPYPKMTYETLMEKVNTSALGGCWIWTGHLNDYGYGQTETEGKTLLVHVVIYEMLEGPVQPGFELDHTCRNRACCNPGHLEPVTRRENVRRGNSPAGINARKTHCDSGHEFTPANTYAQHGGRGCRACQREAVRKYRAKRKSQRYDLYLLKMQGAK